MANKKRNLDFTINVDVITKTTKQLDDYVSKIREIKNTVGDRLSASFLDDTITKIRQTSKEMTGFSKTISNIKLSDKERFAGIDGAVSSLRQLAATMKSLDKNWMTQAIKNNDEMLDQLEEMVRRRKELTSIKGKITKAQNATTKAEEALAGLGYTGGTTKVDSKDLTRQIKDKQKLKSSNEAMGIFDNEDLEAEISNLEEIKKNIDIIIKQRAKLQDYGKEVSNLTAIDGKAGTTNAETGSNRLDTKISNLTALTEAPEVIDTTSNALKDLSQNFDESMISAENLGDVLHTNLTQGKQDAIELQETTQTLKQVFAQFGIGISAVQIVNYFKNLALEAFNFYKSLDAALNEIYVVSNLSAGAVNNLKDEFIAMAEDTGMALDDVTRSAVLFYQQGLSTDEVLEMTEVTSEFAKVAGIDATDAADKLTAAVNGYCLEASDAAIVADKFNKVAAASAADIDELSTAFSKAAAQANQAGVGMDNYLAYIATMVEATREAPENIGTSLKTIMSRMQQVKDAGTTEDGETDVNSVETALKSVGVQLRDTNGELRDLEEVLGELGPKWNTLDRNTQAYLGTIIAGTRQQSRFITLMQNWDRVLELSEDSANSAGQQALMHAKAMESIESKMQQFQVAWQELTSNITSSDFFKNLVVGATAFIKAIGKGNKPVILLGTAFALLSKTLNKLDKPFKTFSKKIKDQGKAFKGNNKTWGAAIKNNIKMASQYKKSQKAVSSYTKIIDEQDSKLGELRTEEEGLLNSQKMLEASMTDEQKAAVASGKEIDGLTSEYLYNKQQLDLNAEAQRKCNEEKLRATNAAKGAAPMIQQQSAAYDAMTKSLAAVAGGLMTISMATEGGISNIAAMGASLLAMISSTMAAVKGLDKAEWSSIILTIIKVGLAIIGPAISLFKTLFSMIGNQDKKIGENVEKVGESLQSYSNALNKAKGADSMIKEYEELASKVYLTASEQERLNTLAQELGDSLELDVVEDQFGNLSLSIEDAKEKLAVLEEEAAEARKEFIKTEQESIEDFDHNGNVDKFYEQYLKKYKADIRNIMSNIDTGIDTDELATSAANVEDIMKNLKNAVIEDSAEMAEAFGGAGIKWSLTEDIESAMEAFNNADIDSSQWNALYSSFDALKENIDSLAYDDVLNTVEGAIRTWGEAAGLTAEQLDLMSDAIMNSLYGSSNLHKTMSGYQETIDKYSGQGYDEQIKSYEQQRAQLEKESTTFWNMFKQDDAEKEYEALGKKIELVKEERAAYEEIKMLDEQINQGLEEGYDLQGNYVNLQQERNRLEKEYGAATFEELKHAEKMTEILGRFSDNSAAYFDKTGMFDANAKGLLEGMADSGDLGQILNAFKASDEEGTKAMTEYLVGIINNTDDEELKKVAQEKLSNVFKNIQVRGTMSWNDLSKELDSTTDSMRKMNSLMDEFRETGGMTLDTFADLCDILDSIDLSTLFDIGAIDQYLGALENLELGFDATNGSITANAQAMQSLEDIQELATQAKLKQTAQSLEADKASLQSQIYAVEAEIAANQALIEWLKTQTTTSVKLDDIKAQGQIAYSDTMNQAVELTALQYQDMTSASSTWAEASITNAAKVGDAIKAAMTGNLGSGNMKTYLQGLVKEMDWSATGSAGQLEILAGKDGQVDVEAAIASLETYNQKGQNTIASLRAQMKSIESMQNLLTKMSESDLSRLGLGEVDSVEIEKYLGQLQEIYNTLRKIEGVEARLNNLEDYSNIARGSAKATYLKEQIGLSQDLVGLNKELLAQQKYMENTEQAAIKNSPVGDVFSFDEFGNIIIDYEKYNKLQDETIDGMQSEKELADALYEEYQSLHETTHDYYSQLITSLEDSINAQQQLVDTYVDLEHDLADSVQAIYQDMLDTKLEAIDAEIEALDKLQEARDRANQAKADSEELSDMQTSLKRAMMDTSGASNTKVLSYQDQIKEKLEQMGEDQYTERLDSIKEALEAEQEQLQRNFDEFFEDWEQLYDLIENRILTSEEATLEVLKSSESYRQASDAERMQMLDEWKTNYATAMLANENDGSITDVVNSIFSLRDTIGEIDSLLQNKEYAEEVGNTISEALMEYYNSREKDGSSSGSGSGSGGSGGTTNNSYTAGDGSTYEPTITTTTKPLQDAKDALEEWSESVKTAVKGWWQSFVEWIDNAASAVGNFFTQTIPNWWTEHIWTPLTNFFTVTIPGWFGTAKETISNWWTENITPLFTLEYWKEKIGNIIYNVSYALTELGLDIKDFWNAHVAKYFTAEFWKEQWDKVCEAFSNGWDSVVTFFTQTVPQWWDEHVAKFFTAEYWAGVWDDVVNGFKTGWNKFISFFTQTIPQWWNDNIAKFFTKEYWVGILSNIKEALSSWWSGIKNWFNSTIVAWWNNNIAKFFTMEYWSNKWTEIKNGFVNGIKKVVNGIADIWNGFVDAISGMFDWLGSAWSWLTGKAKQGSSDAKKNHIPKYETGGIADFTGPAWLDGTKSAPEAVLNAAQTKAFMKLADNLDKLDISEGGLGASIQIDSISFNVESMSSVEDGEAAFDAFVNRFREIGRQTGLAMNTIRLK